MAALVGYDTATKVPLPYATLLHQEATGSVPMVQVMPSVEVAALLELAPATATKVGVATPLKSLSTFAVS